MGIENTWKNARISVVTGLWLIIALFLTLGHVACGDDDVSDVGANPADGSDLTSSDVGDTNGSDMSESDADMEDDATDPIPDTVPNFEAAAFTNPTVIDHDWSWKSSFTLMNASS